MKRILFPVIVAAALAATSLRAATDAEVDARRVALDLAGAFSNDGFKLRDGVWTGALEVGKPKLVQVNLYSGNEYWFALGASDKAKKLAVTIFDETGTLIDAEPYQEGATAAAGFSPTASGPYYVKVELTEGEPSAFCLVYCYK